MARGKFNKRGGGPRHHAENALDIEQRNARLAELDEARAMRRQESDEEEDAAADGTKPSTADGDTVEGTVADGTTKGVTVAAPPPKVEEKVESRKEREAREKAEAYRKRHEAGLTEEYKKDMEKLAEVRKRREEAAARKKMEQEAEVAAEAERKLQAMKLQEEAAYDDEPKKSKGSKAVIPKLDKITIKKMKPNEMKDALKERDLSTQGNKKDLTDRLLKYEAER